MWNRPRALIDRTCASIGLASKLLERSKRTCSIAVGLRSIAHRVVGQSTQPIVHSITRGSIRRPCGGYRKARRGVGHWAHVVHHGAWHRCRRHRRIERPGSSSTGAITLGVASCRCIDPRLVAEFCVSHLRSFFTSHLRSICISHTSCSATTTPPMSSLSCSSIVLRSSRHDSGSGCPAVPGSATTKQVGKTQSAKALFYS